MDDGSSDGTAEALARFRGSLASAKWNAKFSWVWLRFEQNCGKGAVIRAALLHVDTDLVVIHDADLEYHPGDLLKMVEVFLYDDADAVFGSRFLSGGYRRALFFRHSLGNKLLTFLCDLVSDLSLTDVETCYKMMRADLLKSIPLESSTFDIELELAIKLAKRGARIFEVPSAIPAGLIRKARKSIGRMECGRSGRFSTMRFLVAFTRSTNMGAKFLSGSMTLLVLAAGWRM